jgi:hypothetical protein
MRGHPCVGNITNINKVQSYQDGFRGTLSLAGSGRRDTVKYATAVEAETALDVLRKDAGITAATFN